MMVEVKNKDLGFQRGDEEEGVPKCQGRRDLVIGGHMGHGHQWPSCSVHSGCLRRQSYYQQKQNLGVTKCIPNAYVRLSAGNVGLVPGRHEGENLKVSCCPATWSPCEFAMVDTFPLEIILLGFQTILFPCFPPSSMPTPTQVPRAPLLLLVPQAFPRSSSLRPFLTLHSVPERFVCPLLISPSMQKTPEEGRGRGAQTLKSAQAPTPAPCWIRHVGRVTCPDHPHA